jgi:hypothetical protein
VNTGRGRPSRPSQSSARSEVNEDQRPTFEVKIRELSMIQKGIVGILTNLPQYCKAGGDFGG